MKKWTTKFLNQEIKDCPKQALMSNAKNAERLIGLPVKLWLELSEPNKLLNQLKKCKNINIETYFIAGVAVGWAEKNNKIK